MKSTSSKIKTSVIAASVLAVLTVNLLAGGTWACAYKVIVQKDQKPVPLSKESTASCADAVHDLLVSCSVDSTAYVAVDQRWKDILASDSFIHLVGAQSFKMVLATKETIDVREILVPLADNKPPDFVFVRNENSVQAFCKYSPRLLEKLGSIPEIAFKYQEVTISNAQ